MPEPRFSARSSEVVCRIVLLGTYAVVAAISALLLISLSLDHEQALGSLAVCGIAALYVLVIRALARQNRHQAVAYLLVAFYMMLAAGIVWSWGINTPMGLLIFCVVIVLAGILLTARHAPFAAAVAGSILVGVQTAAVFGWHIPDMSWTGKKSSYGDAIAACVIFGMLALVSWLYNREMERSLSRAKQAEIALQQQKATLRQKVEKRTAQLRRAQLEEMQQMYRFAELGQLGVTLLHDLANHLTALTLEIEGMQSKQNSKAIARAREITGYLEEVVDNTRTRLQGATQKQTFNIIRKTSEVVNFLGYKAAKAKVVIDWHPPARSWKYTGDPTCFSQVIAILMSNAIDAYGNSASSHGLPRTINRLGVSMQRDKTHIIITISDWGKGISKSRRRHLFKPFHTTKKTGLGIGLFIARQTVVVNFSGTITLNPKSDHTEFIIKLPVGNEK
ncbi:MAG: HAMP domain-containing sensor histidine kinase [Patescibacteria group bacterium]